MTKQEIIGSEEIRKKRIGGSEFATVMGINPYKKRIELVLEKAGVIANTFEGNDATRRGEALENDIIAMFEDETGLSVSDEQKEFSFSPVNVDCLDLVCHVDGITSDDAVFEAKTTDYKSKTWANGIPNYYKAQLEFNCALADKKFAYIAVGYCKENEIIKFEWFKYDKKRDLDGIVEDCQEFTQDVKQYEHLGTVNNGKIIEDEISNNEVQELIDLKEKISEMKAEIKPFEDKVKLLENKLKEKIGNNAGIENSLYKITMSNRITSPTYEYKVSRGTIKIERKEG